MYIIASISVGLPVHSRTLLGTHYTLLHTFYYIESATITFLMLCHWEQLAEVASCLACCAVNVKNSTLWFLHFVLPKDFLLDQFNRLFTLSNLFSSECLRRSRLILTEDITVEYFHFWLVLPLLGKASMGVSGSILAPRTSSAIPVPSSISMINSSSLSSWKHEPELPMRALPPCKNEIMQVACLLQIEITADVNYLYGDLATWMKFWDKIECIVTGKLFPPQLVSPGWVLFDVRNDLCSRIRIIVSNIHHQVVTKLTHDKEPVLWNIIKRELSFTRHKGCK